MANEPITGEPRWTRSDNNQYIQLLFDCLSKYENGKDLLAGIRVLIGKGVLDVYKMKSLVESTGIPKEEAPQEVPVSFSEFRRCQKFKSGKLLSEFQPCPGCKPGAALKEHIKRYLSDPCYDGSALKIT
jgi:hypothetical protein